MNSDIKPLRQKLKCQRLGYSTEWTYFLDQKNSTTGSTGVNRNNFVYLQESEASRFIQDVDPDT